jgi:hypothetical protein
MSYRCDGDNAASQKRHRNWLRYLIYDRRTGGGGDQDGCGRNREHSNQVFHHSPRERKGFYLVNKQL